MLDRGGSVGLRKSGDSATSRSDGTVRPPRARMRWPSGPAANAMNLQPASACGPAERQKPSVCRTVTSRSIVGKPADVPLERLDRAEVRDVAARGEVHRQLPVDEALLERLGLDVGGRRGEPLAAEREERVEPAARLPGCRSVNRVGLSSSSTSSPPADHTNGAARITLASVPTAWPPPPFSRRAAASSSS